LVEILPAEDSIYLFKSRSIFLHLTPYKVLRDVFMPEDDYVIVCLLPSFLVFSAPSLIWTESISTGIDRLSLVLDATIVQFVNDTPLGLLL
jgi:hypothetical protein